MKYSGQQIGILGCGTSGVAAARLAASLGAGVCVLDSGEGAKIDDRAAALRGEGLDVLTGNGAENCGQKFDLVVASPGIDPSWPIADQFIGNGTRVISEVEFGYQNTDLPVVAITGTNGKTTTTELTSAMLNGGGVRTLACGNYGRAVCDVVQNSAGTLDVLTIEVSSFQLELIETFRPKVAVWMNFAPDHLDRHPSVEAYRAAKLRVFENQRGDDLAVVRWGENVGVLVANTVTFSAFESCGEYRLDGTQVFRGESPLVDLAETRLRGRHNAENVMAAWATARQFGLDDGLIAKSVVDYAPPAHRCELVASTGGVDYVNDSKATNLHALESALRSLDGRVVLIAGGKQKGLNYRPLTALVGEKARAVILIGEIAVELSETWSGVAECRMAADLDEAVGLAAGAAEAGDVVLFSPGTSSFDMFTGYAERGEAFRAAVGKIS